MSGCLLANIDNETAKQLLVNSYTKNYPPSEALRKQAKLNNNLKIIEKNQFDAVLYSLKTLIRKEEDTEVFVELTTKDWPQLPNHSLDSFSQKLCQQCNGKKITRCATCKNSYSINCNYCESDSLQTCHHCSNSTFTFNDKCKTCSNRRFIVCELCKGCGEVNCYKGKVTKTEPIEDFFIKCKDDSIPLMVLCKSKGTVIVDQTRKKLEVINHYPDEGVYRNCKELLEKHELRLRCSPSWKLINQTQKLVVIPIWSYTAICKNDKINFMILGENLDVYVPKKEKNHCSLS